jgi:SAM-dependent methyltransferase
MIHGSCPFCGHTEVRRWGHRPEGQFLRCAACGSIHKELDETAFARLHAQAFQDDAFLGRFTPGTGKATPDLRTWDRLFGHLPPGRLLEIGPGSGHLLAAAKTRGWEVRAVETSHHHRDWIRETWGLTVHAELDELPGDFQADLIVMINVLEHVRTPASLLDRLRRVAAPSGRLFLSLPNARSSVATLAGVWWAMFKPLDHVSIPSRKGLQALGPRSGWQVQRIWSTELPLETPMGWAVALRDYGRARRATPAPAAPPITATTSSSREPRLLRLVRQFPPSLEPLAWAMGLLGRAATLKAWLIPLP